MNVLQTFLIKSEIKFGFTFLHFKKDSHVNFWSGPYLLIEQTGQVNFRVRNLETNKLVTSPIHVNRMKFCI